MNKYDIVVMNMWKSLYERTKRDASLKGKKNPVKNRRVKLALARPGPFKRWLDVHRIAQRYTSIHHPIGVSDKEQIAELINRSAFQFAK